MHVRLEREQRDAVGAVLVARALRPLAREAVARVALDHLQLEAGGRDVLQVEIRLAGPGDAGGPEVGLAGGAGGDLPLGDDVGEREPSARPEHARRLGEHPALVGREIDHAVRDHGVERAVLEGQLLDARVAEAHVLVAAQALGLGELLGRDVHAGDGAARADLRGGREHVHAGAAAEVEHALAREQAREAEVVAHARERVHGLGRQPVEQIGGVAERLGERAAGGEVQVAARLVRHVAVHLRDVAVELLGIHAPGSEVCGVRLHAGSVAGRPSRNLPRR